MGPPQSGPPAVTPRTPPGTTPRTSAPSGATAPAVTTPTSSPPAVASDALRPSAAPGCTDCERLTGGDPVRPGARLTLSYSGFQPGEQVALVMRSTPVELGTFPADAAGTVTADITIPDTAEAGSHTLTLSGPVTGDHVVRFRLAATQEPGGEPVAAPASEGTDHTVPLILGGIGLLLLAGGGLLLLRRRAAKAQAAAPVDSTRTGEQTDAGVPVAQPCASGCHRIG